jgi:hypothetical protein
MALVISGHTHALLDNSLGGVVLQVERVLHKLSHRSHIGVEVRTLRVRYGLKALLPHEVSPIANRKEHDWHRGGVSNAAPTQGSEDDLCHLIDDVIKLNINGSCHLWLHWVEGYSHTDLTMVHAMSHRHVNMVDRSIPVVAEVEECVI